MANKEVKQKNPNMLRCGVQAQDKVMAPRASVAIDEESRKLATKIGGGIISLGIREALRRCSDHNDTEPFNAERLAARSKS
jgi:hypothetical protein